jgi:hypothetical protein
MQLGGQHSLLQTSAAPTGVSASEIPTSATPDAISEQHSERHVNIHTC